MWKYGANIFCLLHLSRASKADKNTSSARLGSDNIILVFIPKFCAVHTRMQIRSPRSRREFNLRLQGLVQTCKICLKVNISDVASYVYMR